MHAGNRYTWHVAEVPAIPTERRMPAASAVAGRLDINVKLSADSPPPTWNSIGRWYGQLAAESVNGTSPELQRTTRQLIGSASDFLSKLQAIARFAQHDVRYVAVEIGIGGYKPHRASEVFKNRFGDCKDKVTVFIAMLREAGIDSRYVIVNATPGVVGDFATIRAFNHVIAAIRIPADVDVSGFDAVIDHPREGRLLIFDPTSSITPAGRLPLYLRGSRGLLVTPDGGELITLPSGRPAANTFRRTAHMRVVDGNLTGAVEETRSGSRADDVRGALQPLQGNERTRYLENLIRPPRAGATVSAIQIEGADDPYADLHLHYSVVINGAVDRIGDMLLLSPWTLRHNAEELTDVRGRTTPYVTDGPAIDSETIEIALPDSLGVDELPKPMHVATPVVTYSTSYEDHGHVIRMKRDYQVSTVAVAAASTADFMAAMGKIRADERNSVVLKER